MKGVSSPLTLVSLVETHVKHRTGNIKACCFNLGLLTDPTSLTPVMHFNTLASISCLKGG